MMWAATLAGIAFGNAGVHVPHGMAYSVAGLVKDYQPEGYPDDEPMVPHGISVIVSAPAVFRLTAETSPDRHAEAATLLGAKDASEPGPAVADRIAGMMKACNVPNGVSGVGYGEADVKKLTAGAIVQKRLLDNAPLGIDEDVLAQLYRDAMKCW